ncbi:MAG: hypothetical protein IJ461_08090, partial [Clostridia bacterium]|nr:hypothetical protein [Clostridia bacterium]
MMMALIAFLFSFAQLFAIPSPFACAMVAVAGAMGESPLFPLLGCLWALGMRLLWGVSLDPWQLAGCLILAFARRFYYQKSDWASGAWAAASLLPRALYALFVQSPAHLLLALASMAMAALCVPAFCQAARLWREPKEAWGWDDRLCLTLVVGLLLCAMGYLYLFRVNLGLLAACLITLCLAHACGGGAGAVGGLLTGTALALCGHGSTPILMLCASGLMAGLISRLESRVKASLTFVLTAALATLIGSSASILTHVLAAFAAALAFFIVKASHLERLKALIHQVTPHMRPRENTYAGEMLRQWEAAIDEMAQSLPTLPSPENALPWQALRRSLCTGCDQWKACWEADDDQQPLMESFWEVGQEGEEAIKAYAAASSCICQRLHLVLPALARAMSEIDAEVIKANRARLEQDMIRTHLTAMAQAVRRLSACAQGESLSDLKGAMDIERVLKETSFPAHLLYVRRPGGHLQCVLESDTPAFTRWQPQRLISDLWAHGGLSMEITQLERGRMYLEETPVFRLETGSATLAMEDVNGDGILSMRFPGGRHLLALSDGMGHGPCAHLESQETLNLLRLCLAADYTRSQAITAVNG